ncbi:MAG: hypothetical protein IJD33_06465 [Clostridia bacterium]|nr:hypothetical protein [Clostridia bacterium]
MKHLKIKLSVLALACLGAGALALQPAAIDALAQYEDINVKTHASITMENGAAVSLNVTGDNGEGFSGIRWTTTVDSDWYGKQEPEEQATFVFGTLVVPTALLEGQELTHKLIDTLVDEETGDSLVLDLVAEGFAPTAENENFYTIINYDEIVENYAGTLSAEEALEKAYGLELTARSYIHVTTKPNNYYYAIMTDVDTSRSAREVALAAELAGDFDKYRDESTDEVSLAKAKKGAQYYGMGTSNEDYYTNTEVNKDFVVSNGAAGTQYVDLETLSATTEASTYAVENFAIEGNIQAAFIGSQRLSATYEGTTLTLTFAAGQQLPTGEHYVVVYTDEGVYTKPIIGATMVITDTEDLAMFSAKGGYGAYSSKATSWDDGDYWRPEQEQSGYYVLGGNIDANSYVHGSRIADDYVTVTGEATSSEFSNGTWNGATVYVDKPIGLTGTFNGLGYTIDGMTIGSQREGFFGIVNGGTVKNVAFNDVKGKVDYNFVIANYLINATIDNVFIAINEYDKNDKVNNPGYAINDLTGILGAYAINDTKLSNIFIRLNSQSTATATFGALFGSMHSDESYTCDNVFVYGRTHFKYVVGTTATD